MVKQGEGEAVNLGFDGIVPNFIGHLFTQKSVKLQEFCAIVGLVQTPHGRIMANLFEARDGLAANALGRGFGRDEFGMGRFELFEFGPKGVVFHVGDDGACLNIVEAVVV